MEAVHWVSNGSQSNLRHSRKHTDSAVYLTPVQKNARYMMLNLEANQKNCKRLCQGGKYCKTEGNVITSE
jgi:hypothetical protein